MRAEPAMFANSLNELLLVLVEPFRAGIKGCEYECTSGRVERWGEITQAYPTMPRFMEKWFMEKRKSHLSPSSRP
jgi:hypothetical protein